MPFNNRLKAGAYFVHYAEKYKSYEKALKKKNGLVIVGTEFRVRYKILKVFLF